MDESRLSLFRGRERERERGGGREGGRRGGGRVSMPTFDRTEGNLKKIRSVGRSVGNGGKPKEEPVGRRSVGLGLSMGLSME